MSVLLFFWIIYVINGSTFVFNPNSRISHIKNWLNNDYPCQDDHIRFEENKKTVTFFDNNIQVSSIILPLDGVIVFKDDLTLGEKSRWQCSRRKSPEDVFYDPESEFSAFSDPASWILEKDTVLHANMVPGANDDVVFHDNDVFQMSIDDQVTVNSLKIDFDWEMTTASFTHFVKTMEGQYQISLGHALAHESVVDGVSRMLPIKDPIIIKRTNQSEEAKNYGVFNPNIKNETLSLICIYVRCSSVAASCINTLRPVGHCCDVCGGTINFSGIKTDIGNVRDLVSNVIIRNGMTEHIKYSVERIDDNEAIPRYQISLFPKKEYGDQMFKALIALINQEMSEQRNSPNFFSVETEYSKKDHSYRTSSKVTGSIVFCSLIFFGVLIYLWRNVKDRERLRSWLFAEDTITFNAIWRHRKGTEDTVELVIPNFQTVETAEYEEKETEEGLEEISNSGTTSLNLGESTIYFIKQDKSRDPITPSKQCISRPPPEELSLIEL